MATAVLLGSGSEEFVDVLRSYAGHLAKNAGFGDGRFVLVVAGGRRCVRGEGLFFGVWKKTKHGPERYTLVREQKRIL